MNLHGPGSTRTSHTPPQPDLVEVAGLQARVRQLLGTNPRVLLGIAGAPGAGKSTLSSALLEEYGDQAVVVGMDGFHLANDELDRLGRRGRKGAPDTFDIDGYLALLWRLRTQAGETIYAPRFDRELETSIGSAVPVRAETRLVITEGNYLLLDTDRWEEVRGLLDEVWYVDVPPDVRRQRLVERRLSSGETPSRADSWVRHVDQPNASLVELTRNRADRLVHVTAGGGLSFSHPKEQR